MDNAVTFEPGGGEYVKWAAAGLPATPGPVAVSIDGGTNWTPAEIVDGNIRVYVAHHTMASPPVGALVLPAGRHQVKVRLTDTPEVPIRPAGWLVAE